MKYALVIATILTAVGPQASAYAKHRAVDQAFNTAGWGWSFTASVPVEASTNWKASRRPTKVVSGLTRSQIIALAERCAPNTPATTLASIVRVESAGDPLTLRDNETGEAFHPASLPEAISVLQKLLARSGSVDIGLSQINSHNLKRLGLDGVAALDACRNLSAAGKVLNENYARAVNLQSRAPLLQTAYSIYNTGKPNRGFKNGYADKVAAVTRQSRETRAGGE